MSYNLSFSQNNNSLKVSETLCEVLGISVEYCLQRDSIAEFFYSTEIAQAIHFDLLIKKLEVENDLNFEIKKVKTKDGNFYFYSNKLSEIFYSYYGLDFRKVDSLIINADDKCKIAYLKGVYNRFGKGTEIKFGGYKKIKTIKKVLNALKIDIIQIYITKGDLTPSSFIIEFKPNNLITNNINLVEGKYDLSLYEKIEIK